MTERNFFVKIPEHIPERLWKNRFAIITIGKEKIKQPIQSAEHYLRLKALRDDTRLFNTGRGWNWEKQQKQESSSPLTSKEMSVMKGNSAPQYAYSERNWWSPSWTWLKNWRKKQMNKLREIWVIGILTGITGTLAVQCIIILIRSLLLWLNPQKISFSPKQKHAPAATKKRNWIPKIPAL